MMARLMFSAGIEPALAAVMAVRRRELDSGLPPERAAITISLISRVKILPRLASSAPFLCLIVAHLECPDMAHLKCRQGYGPARPDVSAYQRFGCASRLTRGGPGRAGRSRPP